ncbi:hypothetical protein GDO81_025051 [Engystomops pustulosus]|uniref:Uncharacterized protein n=1 Tax=Engystomops pustulosus TaxID=76066 RepID=A0AAV6YKB6_ENGPU|nr:hypothetical protein GDO81_025051 [Engystomops pustulosus]
MVGGSIDGVQPMGASRSLQKINRESTVLAISPESDPNLLLSHDVPSGLSDVYHIQRYKCNHIMGSRSFYCQVGGVTAAGQYLQDLSFFFRTSAILPGSSHSPPAPDPD